MTIRRQTSAEAFNIIRSVVSESHEMIMDVMMSRPDKDDWTMREVRQHIIDEGIMEKDRCLTSSISGRLNEMVKLGYIEEDGKRECAVSGRVCIARRLCLDKYRDAQTEWVEEELRRSRISPMELFRGSS